MSQQRDLEARYRAEANLDQVPKEDPFPRMIIVCVGITAALFVLIMGCIFVDFILLRPEQNVRSVPVPAAVFDDGEAGY